MCLKSIQPFLSGRIPVIFTHLSTRADKFRQISQMVHEGGTTATAWKANLTFLVAIEFVFEGTLKQCTVPSKHVSMKKQWSHGFSCSDKQEINVVLAADVKHCHSTDWSWSETSKHPYVVMMSICLIMSILTMQYAFVRDLQPCFLTPANASALEKERDDIAQKAYTHTVLIYIEYSWNNCYCKVPVFTVRLVN